MKSQGIENRSAIAKASGFISGMSSVRKNIIIIKERSSFRLFSSVARKFVEEMRPSPFDELETDTLIKSATSHKLIIALMYAITLYATIMLIKATAMLIRFNHYDQWLLIGPLVLSITATRIVTSTVSIKNIKAALGLRSKK